jgi:hypothetical protein
MFRNILVATGPSPWSSNAVDTAIRLQQFSFWRSTGIDLRLELKPLDHEIHQVIPTIKHHITG